MTEKVLLNSGYKYCEFCNGDTYRMCDKFYTKKITDNKYIQVFYYADYDNYEYELYEERENYAVKKLLYGINYPYTIEEIEDILLNKEDK